MFLIRAVLLTMKTILRMKWNKTEFYSYNSCYNR